MYDCIIVGGGIAGLQAAIQLGRYRHKVLVIDKQKGRSALCGSYHNLLGWPEGVSGPELRERGRRHAERLGVEFLEDEVIAAAKSDDQFQVALAGDGGSFKSQTLLIATGVMDRFPPLPGLEERLGESIYICPDCDGYEVMDRRAVVMGAGEAGSGMAMAISYWTDRIIYVNHDRSAVSTSKREALEARGIEYIEEEIEEVLGGEDKSFRGVRLKDGRVIEGERAFIAFGGNRVITDWAMPLGIERLENKHIVTDPRTKMTGVPGVWAAGDVGIHAEQTSIAMGEGALAAIWIHKELVKRLRQKNVEHSG
ncbi:NAD(P)/FAD-dependent oxidoreductase [Paenibacillus mucilaginosus]|uniref:FAD-dependent pyridine nucleotide-disulfide oxidoreductase n=1 Tax=Paenibacillus mucilaginosus (strain KNP414) TaxID=1036673 RepID=F8FA12_PAEMK|nr:NAD(P)/FAD-dependent oxidoreductase [Paenibacillus mucilaginosus]AEI45210.1 FAD-dependent pyridine nucleotide-disulfide oxidoreductase [Paenibacillus mucilaginosus KNP414]MCG7212901.1 NAD(P)/FAD-dependent oxidoreductase [Paenibacillus mucilaginosus]WDM26683.1 NAD(P)/FAD-dependent oxidoreductase [Paenibacillus mucilaginosus]